MTVNVLYANGTVDVSVPASQKIAVLTDGTAKVSKLLGYPNFPSQASVLTPTTNGQTVYGTFSSTVATTIRIENASAAPVFYDVGTSPTADRNASDLVGSVDPFALTGYAAAQGGAVTVTGGTSSTSANAGGALIFTGGTPGATGVGGAVTVATGAGGSTSGASGTLTVATGVTTAGSGSTTGAVVLKSGAGAASAAAVAGGASGAVTVQSSAGGANTGGATGQVGGAAGTVTVSAGVGGATNSTGAHAGGAGGDVTVTAGDGGAASAGTGNGGAGGSITLTPGAGGTSSGGTAGAAGLVLIRGVQSIKQGTPNAQTVAATLTIANLLTGIVTGTHAAGATQAYTLPTGSNTDAALPDFAADDAFDWVLINLSAAAVDTITLTANTNHTIVGNPIVQSSHSTTGGIYGNSAQFRTRKTASNTYVTYRIG